MAGNRSPIPVFGVTGGIGSGKSAVCAILERQGIPVLSADLLARALCETDQTVRRKIVALLGPASYRADGSYDRPYVADRIFSDRGLQAKLESIVHPAVERELHKRLGELKGAGHRVAAVEAALVFEAGMDERLHAVLVVDAPEALRLERVMKRDGVDSSTVRRRMRAQLPASEVRRRADIIVENDGTLADLGPRVEFALNILRTLLEKH